MEQFEIWEIMNMSIKGLNKNMSMGLSNMGFYLFLAFFFSTLLFYWGLNKNKMKKNGWSMSLEAMYDTMNNMMKGQMGLKWGGYFFTFIFCIFIFMLFSNFMGLMPYNFATTAHLMITLSLSISIWMGVTIMGFLGHGLKFFSYFCPAGTPIVLVPLLSLMELISYIAKGLSLGMSLGANLISGHLLLHILAGFGYTILITNFFMFLAPLVLITAITGLEAAIGAMQSYVFAILSCTYMKDSIFLH